MKLTYAGFIFQFITIIVFDLMIVIAAFIYEQNMIAEGSTGFYNLILGLLVLFLKYFALIFIFILATGSNSLWYSFYIPLHQFTACMRWMTQYRYLYSMACIRLLSLFLLLTLRFIFPDSFIPVFFCILILLIFYGFSENLIKNMLQIQKYPLSQTVMISVLNLYYLLFFMDVVKEALPF